MEVHASQELTLRTFKIFFVTNPVVTRFILWNALDNDPSVFGFCGMVFLLLVFIHFGEDITAGLKAGSFRVVTQVAMFPKQMEDQRANPNSATSR